MPLECLDYPSTHSFKQQGKQSFGGMLCPHALLGGGRSRLSDAPLSDLHNAIDTGASGDGDAGEGGKAIIPRTVGVWRFVAISFFLVCG